MAIDRKKLTDTVNERLDSVSKKKKTIQSSYQKYFDGYTTYTIKKKNGKGTKIVRLYTDDYYSHDCSDKEWILTKITYSGLTALAVTLFLLAALGPSATVTWTPLAVIGSLTIAVLLLYIVNLICYIASPRLMTHWTQTHYHKYVMVLSFAVWTGLAATALLNLIYLIFFAKEGYLTELISTLEYALSGAAVFAVWHKEKDMDYCIIENDTEIPEYAQMVIRYK